MVSPVTVAGFDEICTVSVNPAAVAVRLPIALPRGGE